jgi:hypothetical protein
VGPAPSAECPREVFRVRSHRQSHGAIRGRMPSTGCGRRSSGRTSTRWSSSDPQLGRLTRSPPFDARIGYV